MVGGIERYVLDVAVGQARTGADVRVVTLRTDVLGVDHGPFLKEERLDGVRVIRLPGTGNQRFGLTFRPDRIAREVRRADVVHLHDLRFMTGVTCIAARAFDRPLVYHTHGLLAHTPFAIRLKKLAMRIYYGPLLRLGRASVVASSQNDRELLLRDVPALAPRTTTLLNAVDLGPYLVARRRPIAGRILVIGRVADRKGIDRLLAALVVLHHRAAAPPWSVVIAGTEDTGERARLNAIIRREGLGELVHFHGEYSEEEHVTLLEEAALAVFPSRAEGFGLSLLEAMAAGVPLLASAIPAHAALLSGPLAESLIDFGAPETVADALDRLLTAPPDTDGATSDLLRTAAAPYGIGRLTAEIDALYTHLGIVGRRPSAAT